MPPRHLEICRHRVRGIRAPYLLVLQHHLVGGPTRICAPLVPGELEANVLLPAIPVDGVPHHAVLLNMAAVPLALLDEAIGTGQADDISRGLEAIFSGMPAWLPH
jgi:hypothetical protein